MNTSVLLQLQKVFRTVFENDSLVISGSTSARDIALWDSLTHMELIAATEQVFNIGFSLDEVMGFTCVGDMVDCILKKQEKS